MHGTNMKIIAQYFVLLVVQDGRTLWVIMMLLVWPLP